MSPALVEALVIAGIQYGPGILTAIENLFQKNNPTIADIQAVFAGLQPYSAFGIPASPPAAAAVKTA